jgi:hypothetical protein
MGSLVGTDNYDIHVYFHPYVDGHEDVDVNLR